MEVESAAMEEESAVMEMESAVMEVESTVMEMESTVIWKWSQMLWKWSQLLWKWSQLTVIEVESAVVDFNLLGFHEPIGMQYYYSLYVQSCAAFLCYFGAKNIKI